VHILVLSQYYAPEIGATQTRLRATVRSLHRAGHEITVLTSMPNHLHEKVFEGYRGKHFVEEEIDGVRVLRTWIYAARGRGMKRLANYFSFVASAALGCAGIRKIDLVFYESLPLFIGLTATMIARRHNAKLVMNVPDLWPDSVRAIAPDSLFAKAPFFPAAQRLERWLYRRADLITAVTPGILEALRTTKGINENKLAYLPNGIDPELFAIRPFAKAATTPRVFLSIGSHGYAHGLEVILDAAHQLRAQASILFRFVGDGSTKAKLIAEATRRNLSNVSFHGPVPLTGVADELTACTASLVTLRDDPFYDRTRPARTFPSLACGRPVIFSGRGDFAQMITDQACGKVVAPGDGAALAAAVTAYANSPEEAEADGQRGAAFTHAEHTWDRIVERWLERLP
jgi:glycosyltransferase involved in cell wall biosynthesis